MSRKLYIRVFIAFAAVFVPVFLYFGIIDFVVPSAWIAVNAVSSLFHGKFIASLWAFGHLAVYFLLFHTAARATWWLGSRPNSGTGRPAIQAAVLLALFSCSFIRALTYSSIQGRGGTYTFWGAISRYFETRDAR